MTKAKKTMSIFLSIMMILVTMLGDVPARAESVVPEITFVGVGHSPLVEGDSEAFYLVSKNYTGDVQYRVFLYSEVKGTWEDISKGYTGPVNPAVPYKIVPDKTFTLGKYKLLVWVKRAGMTGIKSNENGDYDSTYTAYLNCVNRDDLSRVYANGNMQVARNVFAVGENIVVNGIEGISGMKAPYSYKLHYYNVGKDSWAKEVTSYDSSIVWKAEEAGVYMLDVWAKSSDSKAKYEAWNLKEIKVEDAVVYREDGKAYAGDSDKTVIITGKNVSYKNAKVNGNVYVYGNDVTLENLNVTGNIVIDPGKDGSTNLNTVTARNIDVRSGGRNSIHLSGVKAQVLTVNNSDEASPVRIESSGDTVIDTTVVGTYSIIDSKSGSLGTIEVKKSITGELVVEFMGTFENPIKVTDEATIISNGADIKNIEIAPDRKDAKITLEGTFKNVKATGTARINTTAGTQINNLLIPQGSLGTDIELSGQGTVGNIQNMSSWTVLVIGSTVNVTGFIEAVDKDLIKAQNPGTAGKVEEKPIDKMTDTSQLVPSTGGRSYNGTVSVDVVNMPEFFTVGQPLSFTVETTPDSAAVSASSSNTAVVAVTTNEHTVHITPVSAGKTTITVSGSYSGYYTGKASFYIDVKPAAPAVTADDTANVIIGINNTMEFKVDNSKYVKYNGTNMPNLAGNHIVLIRVAEVKGVSYESEPVTLNFTYANPAPAAPSVTADDTANVITGLDNTMEFKVDDSEYVKYNGTNAPNLSGEHVVLVRVAENLATDTPAGLETAFTFTMDTPAAPSVTADDTANVIIGINDTMEFKVDAAEYVKYNGTNMPNLAGIHTVLVRVAAVAGMNYTGAPTTLDFTYANPAPAAPSVTADDTANVITGLDNTMEFKVDAAEYIKYNGTNAPNLAGEHAVLVRLSENLAADTPAGSETTLTFTMDTPAAPSVTADDAANVITGINNTMEFMVDAGEYIKYNGINMPGLAGIHTVLVRVAAVLGISYASTPVTLNFTYANPAPAAPSVTADDATNVITGLDSTMEFSIDGSGYVKYDGTNAPDLSGEHTVLVRVAENPATDTPAGLETSLSFTIPVSILNVTATNGTVTITLKGRPTTAPAAGDFTATINVDGAGANALALSGFNYDGNATVAYTFAPVAQTTSVKNAEVVITLAGKETVSAAFIVPALTAQQIALNAVNAAIGDFDCNIPVETLNTATGRTNAISANLDDYNLRIPSRDADFTADSLWQMIDEVNLARAQAALRALGSAGLTCVDPTANPSVTFVRPAPSTDGSGITYSVSYTLGYTNVTPSYINGNPVITRSDTNAGSITLKISILGVRGTGINVYYDVTVPTGTDPVTWVLR